MSNTYVYSLWLVAVAALQVAYVARRRKRKSAAQPITPIQDMPIKD